MICWCCLFVFAALLLMPFAIVLGWLSPRLFRRFTAMVVSGVAAFLPSFFSLTALPSVVVALFILIGSGSLFHKFRVANLVEALFPGLPFLAASIFDCLIVQMIRLWQITRIINGDGNVKRLFFEQCYVATSHTQFNLKSSLETTKIINV